VDAAADILRSIQARKAAGQPFAVATVVRTVAATAAKAGAKAVILPDGSVSEGWIGRGCARAAVLAAAHDALADGKPRLVSVQPPDALQDQGVASGDERAGVRFANNMCPSEGTMDVFVEPVLPAPQLVVCGSSPVAAAIAALARRLGFIVTVCAPASEQAALADADHRIDGYALPVDELEHDAEKWVPVFGKTSCSNNYLKRDDDSKKSHPALGARYVVVSTQGRGDEAALQAALAIDADYVAFVGSRKKAAALKASLAARGVAPERLARLKAPAGLDLGAITPDEIAISILAEIIAVRRGGQARGAASPG
jgi:xanthine dehydrogenase accessory factor